MCNRISWDTESDAFQANRITIQHLSDLQKLFTMTLSLVMRMTTSKEIQEKIRTTTQKLHDDYKEWNSEWIKNPSFETLIPRVNQNIDVYEDLVNWINNQTGKSPSPGSQEIINSINGLRDQLMKQMGDLGKSISTVSGLTAQVAINTAPGKTSRKSYAVSQSLAAEILTRLGRPTSERTIQNWESGKGTPVGYSVEKCCASVVAFQAWAAGFIASKKYAGRKRKNMG